jgi:hypothetical protein
VRNYTSKSLSLDDIFSGDKLYDEWLEEVLDKRPLHLLPAGDKWMEALEKCQTIDENETEGDNQ